MKKRIIQGITLLCILSPVSAVFADDEYDTLLKKALETAANDVAASKKDIDSIIQKYPDRGEGYVAKGLVVFHFDNDSPKANQLFREGLGKIERGTARMSFVDLIDDETCKARSKEENDLLAEAERARNANEPEKVIAAAKKAVEMNAINWRSYYEMGYALIEMDKHKEAIGYFEKGLTINPFSRLLLGESIYSYSHLGEVDKVKSLIAAWNEYLDDVPSIHQELAYAQLKAGNRAGAIATLHENVKKYPAFINSYYFLGEIYFDGGEYSEALPWLRKFVEGSASQQEKSSWVEEAERMIDKCVETLNSN